MNAWNGRYIDLDPKTGLFALLDRSHYAHRLELASRESRQRVLFFFRMCFKGLGVFVAWLSQPRSVVVVALRRLPTLDN